MQIEVTNFLGCKSAKFDIAPGTIAIVGGHNEAGKSSLALGVAAALAEDANGPVRIPIPEITIKESIELVNDDAKFGSVYIRTADGTIDLSLPGAKHLTDGAPPAISEFAAGLKSFAKLTPKERADALIKFVGAIPLRADIANAVKMDEKNLDLLMRKLSTVGWDKTHKDAIEKGAQIKGRWSAITGSSFKPAEGGKWKPNSWEFDLDDADAKNLQDQLTVARLQLEKALKADAVSVAKRSELQEIACTWDVTMSMLRDAENIEQAARTKRDDAKIARDESLRAGVIQRCPHCDRGIVVGRGNKIEIAPENTSPDDSARLRDAYNKAEATWNQAHEALVEAQAVERTSRQAHEALAKISEADAEAGTLSVDAARSAVARAESRLSAYTKKQEADAAFKQFQENQELVAMLAPDGLRQKKLADKLVLFNEALADACRRAGWKTVAIDRAMMITFGGQKFYKVNTAGKRAVDVIFQILFAKLAKDALVIIDEMNAFDGKRRPGILKLLMSLNQTALVLGWMNSPDQLPAAPGKIAAYWMADGHLEPVTAKAA